MMLPAILLQLSSADRVAAKAAHMAEVDPHGFILTAVSVSCVFGVLFLLYVAYTITGRIFNGKAVKTLPQKAPAQGHAAADEEEVAAAIAVALHQYEADRDADVVHDIESGMITIKR